MKERLISPFNPSVAIIGAGFGGLATAVKLLQAGIDNFVIFERSPAPGGTWFDNTYPGCEVDVASPLYSFSFMPYDWPRSHSPADELQRYAEAVVDQFGLRSHCRFGIGIDAVDWDESRGAYRLTTASGDELEFTVVVSAVGFLNVPRYPDWPGQEDFAGPAFHTARWEHEHDFTGRSVALVGTGSTAIQIVPEVARVARRLYVFQREPGWVVPKRVRTYSPRLRRIRRRSAVARKLGRFGWWLAFEIGLRNAFTAGSLTNRLAQRLCERHIRSQITDPGLRDLVTPKYPFGCKRPMFADTYYPALARENVSLIPDAVTEVTADAVVTADGRKYPCDVLIMATGFQSQRYLSSLSVRGERGRDLWEEWGDSPKAFLGLTVPRFPNFFILYGPNTNGGGAITFQLERQAEATARAVSRMRRRRITVLDTRRRAYEWYVRWIDRKIATKFDAANYCHNYYFSPSGRNVTQWPRGTIDYWFVTRYLPIFGLVARRRHRR